MRILHTSDWHLGRTLHGVDLTGAHQAFLDHLVDVARDQQVDAVLVAGDVYDRAIPPLEAIRQLDEALARLTEIAPVIITAGNHDSATRLGFGSAAYTDRLVVRTDHRTVATPVTLFDKDGHEKARIYVLPYLDPDMVRADLSDMKDETGAVVPLARSHEAVMTAALGRVTTDLAARNAAASKRVPTIVMGHAFVVGGEASQVSDSERDIRVGGVDSIPIGVFGGESSPIDYVALGHLHGPQRVGAEEGPGPRVRYAGSPLAFSFSERDHKKASAVVEFDDDGRVRTITPIVTPVARRLTDVSGTLDEVLGRRFDAHHDDWVRVVVRGAARPDQLVRRVKDVFPHAPEVRFEHEDGVRTPTGPSREAADPLQVLDDFVTQMRYTSPTPEEHAVLESAYEAVLAAERSA